MSSPIAVVTGGTRGIGRHIAEVLQQSGHRVIAIARSAATAPPDIEVVECDLEDREALVATFATLGDVDVLINNAGISTSAKIEATSLTDWDRNIAVNVTAPFLCTQAVLPAMRRRDAGRIITVASTASLGGAPYVVAYTASKHAVLGVMRVVAEEVRGTGIGVATVCPTYVRTEMTEATIANIAERTKVSLADAEARLARLTPHGRIIEPQEVASTVVRLVTAPVVEMHGEVSVLDGRPA